MAGVSNNFGFKEMKTLLSVDFDYWVPEKPEYDFGHSESLMFLKMLWMTRIMYHEAIKTTGQENNFWDLVKSKVPVVKKGTWVSDSHAYAHSITNGIGHILLVDAHHDCWEGDSLGLDNTVNDVYCHNWVRVWLEGDKRRRVTWIQPKWSVGNFSVPDDLRNRVKVISEGDDWGVKTIDRVHICRSGCWVPPWLDKDFVKFVNSRGGKVLKMQGGDWDPMAERWTEEEFLAGLDQNQAMITAMRKIIRIGEMPSGDFLNGRVELSVKK